MQNVHTTGLFTIEDPAGRLDDLPIPSALKLRWFGATSRVDFELIDVLEDSLDEAPSCFRVIQRDVIGDGVEITECRLGPDYFSHRAIRCLA